MRIAFISLLTLSLLGVGSAFMSFQNMIPNGASVPHPCQPGVTWGGLGHLNPNGGGDRNAFGQAFADNGFQWNDALCRADSDGDGKTNGEELGDPDCVWVRGGDGPSTSEGITHPGVCDPYDSDTCAPRNAFLECVKKDVIGDCQSIKRPDTQTMDLRLPSTEVPPTETNYFCMTFDLPSDQDYHIKAFEPIKDNMNVLHHILLFGCEDSDQPASTAPGPCSMSTEDCGSIIGLWGVGVDAKCYEEEIGFRIGQSGFKRAKIEVHWNNPMLTSGWRDGSGFKLYYQPARPEVQDMVSFMTGQNLLAIPPQTPRISYSSTCNSGCTSALFAEPVKVVNSINHMHYLGREMSIQVFRDGKLLTNLTHDTKYEYDNPTDVEHTPHLELLPGDAIKTTCVFSSLGKDRWTYYGDGTSDEMCFGFLIMYPASAFPYGAYCVNTGELDVCDQFEGKPLGECDWKAFTNFTHPDTVGWLSQLNHDCNFDGFCRPECREISKKVNEHPCMQGEIGRTVKAFLGYSHEGTKMLGRVHSCQRDASTSQGSGDCSNCDCSHDQHWTEQLEEEISGWVDASSATPTGSTTAAILFGVVACWVMALF